MKIMKTARKSVANTNKNIMELLVNEEVDKQVRQCSSRMRPFINKVEVATFALNHLPPLYASTEEGKQYQMRVGRKKREQIALAVRQGIIAVQRDPLRQSIPLIPESGLKYYRAEQALKNLEEFLQEENLIDYPDLSWCDLVRVIRKAFRKVSCNNGGLPM